jgi:two-component system, LytTR family, sensor kinase
MRDSAVKSFFGNIYRSPAQQFWLLQFIYWSGVSFVTFFTLTLWYGHYGWVHISHTLFQGVLGLALSVPLRIFYLKIWDKPLFLRCCLSLVGLALVAALWTAVRMITFIWISSEENVWADFGGWYFGAIFIFLGWGSLFHGMRYFQLLLSEHEMTLRAEAEINREQVKRLQAESVARDSQMMMLRYQLNPHFLFNTLNAINALVQMKESSKAQRMIVQLSQFLRYSLDNNPDVKLALKDEIDALMLYLDIEKTRFGERLNLDFQTDEASENALVPSLLLQPLIENSLKYAIAKSETGGTIKLRAKVQNGKLVLELSDTGPSNGIQTSKIKSQDGRGIGLKNTIDRLKALYLKDYDYKMASDPSGGLKTIITIPYEMADKKNYKTIEGDIAAAARTVKL